MSTTTTNLELHKPELTDPADITKMNPNWDKIDSLLSKFTATTFKNITFQHHAADGDDRLIAFFYVTDTTFWRIDVRENGKVIQYRYLVDGVEQLNFETKSSESMQSKHYYYEVTDFGCTTTSTISEVWKALPDKSVFVYQVSGLTDNSWNFPTQLGILRIEKFNINRGSIQLFSKVLSNKDYRMHLDDVTGEPSGVWCEYYTSGNKPTVADIGALEKKPAFIELTPSTSADNGGYIDFHYAGSTEDHTSRIIEGAEGKLTLQAPNGVVVSHPSPTAVASRNSYAGTSDMEDGVTPLTTGVIYYYYEE